MKKTVAYDDLPFVPLLMAKLTAEQPYENETIETKWWGLTRQQVQKIESMRSQMTTEDIDQFAKWVDSRCRLAYMVENSWFQRAVGYSGNKGRDTVYGFINHWLAYYLLHPELRPKFVAK